VITALLSGGTPTNAASGHTIARGAQPRLTLISQHEVQPNMFDLTLKSAALGGRTVVRVLLPADYSTSSQRYPVIYLYHGGQSDHTTWTADGRLVQAVSDTPVIIVMPDCGPFGYHVNWYNGGRFGAPAWETYENHDLVPFIDHLYRTIADRAHRAVAGASMGGFGAVANAERHPDLYGAVGSFSGAVDIMEGFNRTVLQTADTATPIFGSLKTNTLYWRGNNPVDLAANLSNTSLMSWSGNGLRWAESTTNLEKMVRKENVIFNRRLTELHIPHTYTDTGLKLHVMANFEADFKQWLPHVMAYFTRNTPMPTSFTYATIRPHYSVYKWGVSVNRRAKEFSALQVQPSGAFSVTGSGTASVTTPPVYTPGQTYTVQIHSAAGEHTRKVTASPSGRLTVTLALGPSNPFKQFTKQAARPTPAVGTIKDPPFTVIGDGSHFYRTSAIVTS
jgi:S-formylglutathione hydrolase FrmB